MIYCNVKLLRDIENDLRSVDKFIEECNGNREYLELGVYLCDIIIKESKDERLYLYEEWAKEDNECDIESFEDIKKKLEKEISKIDKKERKEK